jgi:hypothetical protein
MDGSEDQGSRARQVEYDQGVHRLPRRDHEQHQPGRVIQRTLHQQLALLPQRHQHEHLEYKFPLEEIKRRGKQWILKLLALVKCAQFWFI